MASPCHDMITDLPPRPDAPPPPDLNEQISLSQLTLLVHEIVSNQVGPFLQEYDRFCDKIEFISDRVNSNRIETNQRIDNIIQIMTTTSILIERLRKQNEHIEKEIQALKAKAEKVEHDLLSNEEEDTEVTNVFRPITNHRTTTPDGETFFYRPMYRPI